MLVWRNISLHSYHTDPDHRPPKSYCGAVNGGITNPSSLEARFAAVFKSLQEKKVKVQMDRKCTRVHS